MYTLDMLYSAYRRTVDNIFYPNHTRFSKILSKSTLGEEDYNEIHRMFTLKLVDPNTKGMGGFTVLHRAVRAGQIEWVKRFISQGCDVNSQTKCGQTPLGLAAANGYLDCVQELLGTVGILVDLCDKDNVTPLLLAAELGHEQCVQALINAGADVNVQTGPFDLGYIYTPLSLAAQNGHLSIVQLLADRGARINVEANNVLPAVFQAVTHNKLAVLRELIRRGANLNARSHIGWTALTIAAVNGDLDAIKVILEVPDVDKDIVNAQGLNAAQLALNTKNFTCYEAITGQSYPPPELVDARIKRILTLDQFLAGPEDQAKLNALASWQNRTNEELKNSSDKSIQCSITLNDIKMSDIVDLHMGITAESNYVVAVYDATVLKDVAKQYFDAQDMPGPYGSKLVAIKTGLSLQDLLANITEILRVNTNQNASRVLFTPFT